MNPFELQKSRVLFFDIKHPGELEQAYLLLGSLDNLDVGKGALPNSLEIQYSVEHYSLEGLEKMLRNEGFHLQYTTLGQLKNSFVHYCEDVQYHNLNSPEPRTKNNSQEVFVKAYEQHPHGDYDSKNKPQSK